MAGGAAARALKAPPEIARSQMDAQRFVCRLACRQDDPDVRRLLRENPFVGAVQVSLECEPDAAAAAAVYGPVHQTMVVEDRRSAAIVATACRAEREVFVNGRPQRLGYLGQLRVDSSVRRHRRLLSDGFALCRALHDEAQVPAYLVSIVGDNRPARRLLESGRIAGQPTFTPLEPLVTLVLSVGRRLFRRAARAADARIVRGCAELACPIAECLQQFGARHQFSPVWTASDLVSGARAPGLSVENFLVAMRGGRVTACLACWDQRAIRQVVVRGYSGALSRGRALLNLARPLTGALHLPRPGATLACAFLSHVAADETHSGDIIDLVDAALTAAPPSGVQSLVLGLSARHPLVPAIARRFRHRRYVSQLYLAHWRDGEAFVRSLDDRIVHPEVAVL